MPPGLPVESMPTCAERLAGVRRRASPSTPAARHCGGPPRPVPRWSSPTATNWPRSSAIAAAHRRRRRRRPPAARHGGPARCWPASAPTAPCWSTTTASSSAAHRWSARAARSARVTRCSPASSPPAPGRRRPGRGPGLGRGGGQPSRAAGCRAPDDLDPTAVRLASTRTDRTPGPARPCRPRRPASAIRAGPRLQEHEPSDLKETYPMTAPPPSPSISKGRVQGHRPAVRWLPGRHGHAQHRGVHRLGPDHRSVHPDRLAAERGPRRARRADDHVAAARPDRLHRRPPGARTARRGGRRGRHRRRRRRHRRPDVPRRDDHRPARPRTSSSCSTTSSPGGSSPASRCWSTTSAPASSAAAWPSLGLLAHRPDRRGAHRRGRQRRRLAGRATACCRWCRSSSSRPRCCSSTTRSTTACSHRSASPRSPRHGKSILFMIETNPGPGLGILLAYLFFGPRSLRPTVPAAIIIQFFGGIHEIYFPYVLMKPRLILASHRRRRRPACSRSLSPVPASSRPRRRAASSPTWP